MSEQKQAEPWQSVVLALILTIPAMLFRGWAIYKCIAWFLVPIHPAAADITLLAGMGLATLAQCMLPRSTRGDEGETALGLVGRNMAHTAMALVVAYGIKSAQVMWPML